MKYTIDADVVLSSINTTIEIGDRLIIHNNMVIAVEKPKLSTPKVLKVKTPKMPVELPSPLRPSPADVIRALKEIPEGMTVRQIGQHFGGALETRVHLRDVINELLVGKSIKATRETRGTRYPKYVMV